MWCCNACARGRGWERLRKWVCPCRSSPQRLKPLGDHAGCGTAEAVPLSRTEFCQPAKPCFGAGRRLSAACGIVFYVDVVWVEEETKGVLCSGTCRGARLDVCLAGYRLRGRCPGRGAPCRAMEWRREVEVRRRGRFRGGSAGGRRRLRTRLRGRTRRVGAGLPSGIRSRIRRAKRTWAIRAMWPMITITGTSRILPQ